MTENVGLENAGPSYMGWNFRKCETSCYGMPKLQEKQKHEAFIAQ